MKASQIPEPWLQVSKLLHAAIDLSTALKLDGSTAACVYHGNSANVCPSLRSLNSSSATQFDHAYVVCGIRILLASAFAAPFPWDPCAYSVASVGIRRIKLSLFSSFGLQWEACTFYLENINSIAECRRQAFAHMRAGRRRFDRWWQSQLKLRCTYFGARKISLSS